MTVWQRAANGEDVPELAAYRTADGSYDMRGLVIDLPALGSSSARTRDRCASSRIQDKSP